MATAATMAALRAMVLGNGGGGGSNEDGCRDSKGEDYGNSSNSIGDNRLCHLAIVHFVTRHIVANAIAHVVAITITFVNMQQRG